MAEIRPAASLTSSLLARRGDARPAMRRQPLAQLHMPLASQDDLGWNDIGDEGEPHHPPMTSLSAMTIRGTPLPDVVAVPEEPAPAPVVNPAAPAPISPLTHHLEAISQRLNQSARDTGFRPMLDRASSASRPAPRAELASTRKAAFTLRIDSERHLRLRLLSALVNRSSQQLLIEALDALLAAHEEVEDLAGQVEKGAEVHDETTGL